MSAKYAHSCSSQESKRIIALVNEPVDVSARWRELQGLYLSTAAELERTLQQSHHLGLSEYEVLDLVAGYAKESCTMRNLVDLTPMTQSALSRIVDRLVKAGL
uniref:MarR family transcriptional regulator n=1 Tax=Vibrio cidicii TaxID=1763883 RepID=UPI0037039334